MREIDREDRNCHDIITSENYADIFRRISVNIEEVAANIGGLCYQRIAKDWVLFHVPIDPEDCDAFYRNNNLVNVPNLYGLSSISSMGAAGISPILNSKILDLSGNGVIIAIIDTGIDYTHEAFIYEDNTSKVLGIWDQTIGGNPPEGFLYGTEYTNEQINEAINSDDPLAIVPSVDEIGHGTFLAGLAAGRANLRENFLGAAPNSDLIIVKLKQAKKCIKNFYAIKEDAVAYQSNDIVQGLNYVRGKVEELDRPVVFLFACGSSDGPHNGTNEIEEIFANYGDSYGRIVIISAGNEADANHHFHGKFQGNESKMSVQFNVADNEKGVFLNMWSPLPDRITIELISPSGSTTGRIPFKTRQWQQFSFPLETSDIHVHYDLYEERAAEEQVVVIIKNPLAGLWTMVVYGEIIVNGEFDIWLPVKGFINNQTLFLSPNPYTTLTIPSTNVGTITVGAFNERLNSIYLPSGRGPTRDNQIKPDIVAPGVNVISTYPRNSYGVMSGTSVGAAITAGACALLLEWAIVKGNDPSINTVSMKTYLARGATRRNGIVYPNREWGYGELNLINTFEVLQSL